MRERDPETASICLFRAISTPHPGSAAVLFVESGWLDPNDSGDGSLSVSNDNLLAFFHILQICAQIVFQVRDIDTFHNIAIIASF